MRLSKTQMTAATALLMAATQIQAGPVCLPRHLDGHYVMYQNSVAPANPHIGKCEIEIERGVASGTCAFTSQGPTAGFSGPVSGTASIARNCSAELQIDFAPNPANPALVVHSFFDLQFAPDRNSFVGQWTNSFGLVGTTGGVRN
ncbi:hypothetical protein [Methyloterricola oryzae]|uniref:hypothetical protein n=1 Tax=Methyloterricola oryzae TaxID=1495050 RepID=UPI0005EB7161|nr:hypothetical protein [Methyloterricola oryzae]